MKNKAKLTKKELIFDFLKIGIQKGDILNLKISLKSIGFVEGGADTVINALLEVVGEEGTLVTDSFIKPFPSYLKFLNRNKLSTEDGKSYAGAITNAIMKKSDVFRASHPIQRFAAIGKYAKELTENFTPASEPYGFLKQMAYMNAKNLRVGGEDKVVGVGTTHIAICDLGLKQLLIPRGIYYIDKSGEKKFYSANWANGCPKGFNNLINLYRKNDLILSEEKIGNAQSMITSMESTLKFEMNLFSKQPDAFLCDNPTCPFCSFTWKDSKYTFFDAILESLKRKKIKTLYYFLKLQLLGKYFPR